jgi:predicted nucleotidyltransferase component of viral defense system
MKSSQELRKIARERRLALDLVEKDYVLGWILFGIASGSISKHVALKGGTALSKVYFPGQWRLSEDLDFTLADETDLSDLVKGLSDEVPNIVEKASGISVALRKAPFINPNYLQCRFQYTGPVSKNNVKIEVSKEGFIDEIVQRAVPQMFDYPRFSVDIYSLDNILAEKIRTLLERGKVKDYYDVWKLLKVEKFDRRRVKSIFLQKCEAKGVVFTEVKQFFPAGLIDILKPHLKVGLAGAGAGELPEMRSREDMPMEEGITPRDYVLIKFPLGCGLSERLSLLANPPSSMREIAFVRTSKNHWF